MNSWEQNKGQKGSRQEDSEPRKVRIQGSMTEQFKKFAAANAKLSMHLAGKSRMHDSALLQTVLLPKTHPVAEAMTSAGIDFNRRQKQGELAGIPPHLIIWRAAINAAMAIEQGNGTDKEILAQYVAAITSPDLLTNRVHCCRATSAFQPNTTKVSLSVSAELKLESFVRILIASGGDLKLGAPPRSTHERELAKMLIEIGQWQSEV
ncbi:unnamed protein product [Polarella glacialis]|uniref:Uncharacterized protein n=1 Tax=Polarella glacialis TaxID=89957 RepID=A0A813LH30_POLGL|nr:unnamed protein product [Polarella glacialis]CAE8723887.1 unnamed protein product [Polarella glacialis]